MANGGIGRPACRQAGARNIMYFVYAIKSIARNYIYVGISNDIQRRFSQHNSRREKTTRAYAPFKLIYHESFLSRSAARHKEKYLKSGVGKELRKSLE